MGHLGIFQLAFYKKFMFCHTNHLTHCIFEGRKYSDSPVPLQLISLLETTDLVKQDSHTDSHFFLRNLLMNGLLSYFFILSRGVYFSVEKMCTSSSSTLQQEVQKYLRGLGIQLVTWVMWSIVMGIQYMSLMNAPHNCTPKLILS